MKEKLITICKYKLKFNYYVREDGTIYSEKSNRVLSPQLDKDGYQKVQMMSTDNKRHRYSIHRLVMENFNPIENMDNMQVNHIDGDKTNNNLSNLEWCTCEENIHHAMKNNLRAKRNGSAKLKEEEVKTIYLRAKNGESCSKLGTEYHVCEDTIRRIRDRILWKQVTENL